MPPSSQAARRRALFLEGPIPRALITLAIPIIVGNVLQTGYQLTDAFWVGRLGAAAVAAVSVSFPVTFLVIALGSGLAMAGGDLERPVHGRGKAGHGRSCRRPDHGDGDHQLHHPRGHRLCADALAAAPAGVEPDVYDGALGFMRVSFIGIIFVFVYAMFQALMRGIGQTRVPVVIVLGTVILNFALDPLFIFGWGPIPALGVMGAALATLITQALAAAIGIAIFLRGRHGIVLRWHALIPTRRTSNAPFFLGLPGSVELSTRGLGLMIMSFLVASFGTLTIASYGVGSNVLQVVTILPMGLSMAISTLVGQNMGAGNIERASRVAQLGALFGFIVLTCAGLIAYGFAPEIVASSSRKTRR